ncbi:uncharacterized protein ELE39_001375 [Cryptosporidium sp. chipmunk genotype I]|uniref:uncharacterized protein n=1 Tax=Cryptosporidium sp. chipmunk genotype I TaxID=1280935 RepID=UPI00351A39AB|nr:hypothetical protein ELE39_001375 [Cryptosporidium sp. chipmunk genotype I]
MWSPLNALRSKKVGFLVIFLLNIIFSDVNIELFKNERAGWFSLVVEASESSSPHSMDKLDMERRRKHPETGKLPRYPVPGMRYDELSESESDSSKAAYGKKKKSVKSKKAEVGSKSKEEGDKASKKKKKSRSGSGKSKKSLKDFTSSDNQEENLMSGGKAERSVGVKQTASSGSGSFSHKSTSTDGKFSTRERRKLDKSKLSMSEYKSYLPGVDSIWQDPSARKTYKHLNPQYGDYFPRVATKPYRKSNECSALFDSAKKAFDGKEIKIHPADFVGLSLTLAVKLREVLGQYVTIQETCLMLRMLLHLYSGMRTRTQFLNIIAAVLQNDILLGRLSDDSGVITEVMHILDFFLQLPKHRADTKSKQMSAIELSDYFHLEIFPKDNSYESRLLPFYRRIAERLMNEIERRLGIVVARDEVMSMVYIVLNFIEEERSQEQCTEIMVAVIGATYTNPLTTGQLIDIANMARDILGCKASSGRTMDKAQIMDIFGPEKTVVEMRQTTLVGGPISDTLRIWKEVGTLDYLGRVISVRFNDCNGIKAWQMNRICSMLEVMNEKLIKTGSSSEIITLEELCGAFKYKTRHPGTKWSLAIKTTLQKRQNSLPVKVEKLFSHFIAHEKKRLASLEGSIKGRMEKFYMIPEFPKPSFLDSITPSSPAQGIPPADHLRPDFFYAFNSMPGWLQNRFVFASAFMEEILVRHGHFVHISPVRLYNALGGRLDENSDISLVIQGLGLTQEQYRALPKAFCAYEKRILNEYNLNSNPMTNDEYLEAFYEYPLAKYVEGRYLIEAAVDVLEVMNEYLLAVNAGAVVNIFPQLVTQERLQRVYLFQAFINSRVKSYSNDSNISFVTTEEANRILIGSVDNSNLSYITEMRTNLSPTYYTDSMIEILAQEWSVYENIVLPRILDLSSDGQEVINAIYSTGMTFAALSLDGWELLFDPTIALRSIANGESLSLNYSTNSVQEARAKENRVRLVYYWIQQYFIYKLRKIPKFNYEEVRALVEALPDENDFSEDRIRSVIQDIQSLALSNNLIEDFSYAIEAYLFFEKYFLYTRNPDLEGGFATEVEVVNGKIYVPNFLWAFLKDRDDYSNSDIESQSVVHFADMTLAYVTRLFQTQPHNQDLFINVLEWANAQNLNNDSIFSTFMLSIQDFQLYIQHNTKLRYNPHAFLVPWVDHLPTNYQFRRLRSLPSGIFTGLPSEGPDQVQEDDQSQRSQRAAQILSEIERLSLEHITLLEELNTQATKEETAMLVVERIRADIHALLLELGTLSSTLFSSAMLILSNRRIASSIGISDTQQMSGLGVNVGENGEITFDEELAVRGLSGIFTPALILGDINPETGVLETPPPGIDPELSCSTQNINRMQAFRLWINSVLPRMPFHCSDPLLARDLLSVEKLLPAFVSFGFSLDSNLIASSLVTLLASHPFPMALGSLNTILKFFLSDEQSVFSALDRPASNLQEAYQDLRMIAGFYKKKTTLPLLEVPTIFSFTPNLELLGSTNSEDFESNSHSNARVNFLDYLERITAEYYASSPRRMPTIAIPRLTNLAMNFSNDFDQLVFLISSIFGPMSPYISAPSVGASAMHLAEFYIMNLQFSETIDSHYIEKEFRNSLLKFGSPCREIRFIQSHSNDLLLDFKWTFLSAHFFSSDEAYFNSFLAMSDLINMALNYASSKTGISVSLSHEVLRRISFSFITGQNLLEAFRTNIDLSSQNLGFSLQNKFYSDVAKSFSFLISQLKPFLESSDNRSVAEEILQSAISDIHTRGFYPVNVRHEMVNRITLFIDLESDRYQQIFVDLEDSLNSINLNLPKEFSSHSQMLSQRFLTQRSEAALISEQGFVTRTPICNYALAFSFFLSKILQKPQNKNKIGQFDPLIYSNASIWSDFCGVKNFVYINYRTVLISTIKNLSKKLGNPLAYTEVNRLVLLIDFFDQNVRKIILKENPDLPHDCSNETLFSRFDACLKALERFERENDIVLDELQMSNSDPLAFSDELSNNHFFLLSNQEESVARVQFKGMLENLFIPSSSQLEDEPGINRQISLDFFSDLPLDDYIKPENIVVESFDRLYDGLPFKFQKMKLSSGKKDYSSVAISYLDVGGNQTSERYDLKNSFLHEKKISCVNRAVLFQHWWLIVWPKIPFYTNDFVLAELLSRIEILSQAFQSSCMFTSSEVIFSSISKQISGISGISIKKEHIYLMIEAFLESESKALEFSGAGDLESAYSSDTGMLNSLFSIDHKIPKIPIPKGHLVSSVGSENKNLSQYLFRIISEYFAANPRNYPTIIIPNTSFLARHFDLNKKYLAYALYVWSEFETDNSIRIFFQAPTIGASYEDLAEFIIENFELNFLNFSSSNSYLQFFTDPLFSTFFKFGSPLFRVRNIQLGVRCSRVEESCNPFIPNFGISASKQKLLEENVSLIVSKSFVLAAKKMSLSPSSEITRFFSASDVSEAIILGINILDAVRVHGFGSKKLQENLVIINKFSLLFSKIFSRFITRFLESFRISGLNRPALDLSFSQAKALSARTFNVFSQFNSDLLSLTLYTNEDLSNFLNVISIEDLVPAEKYQAFYAVSTSDSSRGMMTVYTKATGLPVHLQITRFNYIYCFIHYLLHILSRTGITSLHISFKYHSLLNFENVVRATAISIHEGIPEAVLILISQRDKFALGRLTLEEIRQIYVQFKIHTNYFFGGGSVQLTFASSETLTPFIQTFTAVKYIRRDGSVAVTYLNEFENNEFSHFSPKSQSISSSFTTEEILNSNFHRDSALIKFKETSFITGSFVKPWVPFLMGLSSEEPSSVFSEASGDHLVVLDPGHVDLRKRLVPVYILNQNLDLSRTYNSLIDLGSASFESGVISLQSDLNAQDESQASNTFNNLRVNVLNRAVLFREWLIRVWDISPAISRDPLFLEFLKDFESIVKIFDGTEIRQGVSLRMDVHAQFIHKTGKLYSRLLVPLIDAYTEFEERIVEETGSSDISKALESGVAGLFLLSLPIRDPFQRMRCQIKNKAWGEKSDSHRRSQILDFVAQKLIEYLSAAPRSAFTIDIPDVSVILDNFSDELPHKTKCAIEFWARDRPDLISAPSLGLDSRSIFEFLSSFLTTAELDQDNLEISLDKYLLSYGLLDEYPIEDASSYYGNSKFVLKEHESLYDSLVVPLLGDSDTANAITTLLRAVSANVLDTYDFNHFLSEDTEEGEEQGQSDSYVDYSLNLDYRTFAIRMLLGVSETFSARKLFEPVPTLKSAKDLNKVSSDFLRKISVLKACFYETNFDQMFYDYYSAEMVLAFQRSGLRLKGTDKFSLFLSHILFNFAHEVISKPELITDCFEDFKFKQRPSHFSTIPDLGHVSQKTGLITSSFKNFSFEGLQESFVPHVNLLVFYLKSLNSIINHPGNKLILSIPASINFMSTGILLKLSGCDKVIDQGHGCIAQIILNSLLDTGSDVGNLTEEALIQILDSLYKIVGEVSYASYSKLDSPIIHIDPVKNRATQTSVYTNYNQNLLSVLFGNLDSLERMIKSRFEHRFLDVRMLSKSLKDSYDSDPLINARLSNVLKDYPGKRPSWRSIHELELIPAFFNRKPPKKKSLALSEFLTQMGLSNMLDMNSNIFPTLLKISRADDRYMIVSNNGKFPSTSASIANRAAIFHSFVHISTYPYSEDGNSCAILPVGEEGKNGKKGISLEDSINFFSAYSGTDILQSVPKISKYFKNIEFYKAYQLLDSFYALEKQIFGFDAIKGTIENVYSDVLRASTLIDGFIPLLLDLEIPKFEGKEANNLGKIIMLLGRKFIKSEQVRAELTLERCISIARHFWPLELDYLYTTSKHSTVGYYALLSVLENLPSIRKVPIQAQEFVFSLNWYIYNVMGSDPGLRDFSNPEKIFKKRVEFLKKAFSKPFVCSEKDLPWVKPEVEYSGVSFPQFNFIMYIATAWRTYVESKISKGSINIDSEGWSSILRDVRPGLISMLDSLSHGISLKSPLSLSIFSYLTYSLIGEEDPSVYQEDEMKKHLELFLSQIQRFSRVRHPGVINVSFLWPAVDCEPFTVSTTSSKSASSKAIGKMVVPGLSFPMTLNRIGGSDSATRSSSRSTTKEIFIDSLGEFFQGRDNSLYSGLEEYDSDADTAPEFGSGESTDDKVQEEIIRGLRLEDLSNENLSDGTSVATNGEQT